MTSATHAFDRVPVWVKHPMTKIAACIPGIGIIVTACANTAINAATKLHVDKPITQLNRDIAIANSVQGVLTIALFVTLIALSIISSMGSIAIGLFTVWVGYNIKHAMDLHKQSKNMVIFSEG